MERKAPDRKAGRDGPDGPGGQSRPGSVARGLYGGTHLSIDIGLELEGLPWRLTVSMADDRQSRTEQELPLWQAQVREEERQRFCATHVVRGGDDTTFLGASTLSEAPFRTRFATIRPGQGILSSQLFRRGLVVIRAT